MAWPSFYSMGPWPSCLKLSLSERNICKVLANSLLITDLVTFAESDYVAVEVPGLQWLFNSPKLAAIAIDEDGWPVPMRVPDPRDFALHKAWLSGLATRETIKKPRDFEPARIVARLVRANMPQLSFESTLTSLHGDVRKMLPLLLAEK